MIFEATFPQGLKSASVFGFFTYGLKPVPFGPSGSISGVGIERPAAKAALNFRSLFRGLKAPAPSFVILFGDEKVPVRSFGLVFGDGKVPALFGGGR